MKLLKGRKGFLGDQRLGLLSNMMQSEYDRKLSKLSNSCNMSKQEMMNQLLKIALDSPNVVEWLQDQYNKVEEDRVYPLKINNKIYY